MHLSRHHSNARTLIHPSVRPASVPPACVPPFSFFRARRAPSGACVLATYGISIQVRFLHDIYFCILKAPRSARLTARLRRPARHFAGRIGLLAAHPLSLGAHQLPVLTSLRFGGSWLHAPPTRSPRRGAVPGCSPPSLPHHRSQPRLPSASGTPTSPLAACYAAREPSLVLDAKHRTRGWWSVGLACRVGALPSWSATSMGRAGLCPNTGQTGLVSAKTATVSPFSTAQKTVQGLAASISSRRDY